MVEASETVVFRRPGPAALGSAREPERDRDGRGSPTTGLALPARSSGRRAAVLRALSAALAGHRHCSRVLGF